MRPEVPLLGTKYDVRVRPEVSLSLGLNATLAMESLVFTCDNLGVAAHVTQS